MSNRNCKWIAGDIHHTPAKRTRHSVVPGCDAPLGYYNGADGFLWTKAQDRRVLKVRKTRGKATWDLYLEGGARVTVEG